MKNTFIKFLLLSVTLFLLTEFMKNVLSIDNLIYNSLTEKLTSNQIESYFELQSKWKWLGYVFVPVFILLKILIIASCVS